MPTKSQIETQTKTKKIFAHFCWQIFFKNIKIFVSDFDFHFGFTNSIQNISYPPRKPPLKNNKHLLFYFSVILFLFLILIFFNSICVRAYCPQGPQWSSFDKSILQFIFVLHFSILHLPRCFGSSFGIILFRNVVIIFFMIYVITIIIFRPVFSKT